MTPGGFWFGFGVVTGLLLHPWLAHFVATVRQRWAKLDALDDDRRGDRQTQDDPDDLGRR